MADNNTTSLQEWALPELANLLPLDPEELKQIIAYAGTLSDNETNAHLTELLGGSAESRQFIDQFVERRQYLQAHQRKQMSDEKYSPVVAQTINNPNGPSQSSQPTQAPQAMKDAPPAYLPPAGRPPVNGAGIAAARHHSNPVIEAGKVRAKDEVRVFAN